jgi:hypothetical protein
MNSSKTSQMMKAVGQHGNVDTLALLEVAQLPGDVPGRQPCQTGIFAVDTALTIFTMTTGTGFIDFLAQFQVDGGCLCFGVSTENQAQQKEHRGTLHRVRPKRITLAKMQRSQRYNLLFIKHINILSWRLCALVRTAEINNHHLML